MHRKPLILALLAVIAAGVVTGVVVGLGSATPAARAGDHSTGNGLHAYIVPNTRGPLPACSPDGSDCTPANTVWHFIHVTNDNSLPATAIGTNRATLQNSFVVGSVEWETFVNGVEMPDLAFSFTPPPDASPRSWSGHWLSTATCEGLSAPPCNVIASPAVVPGEDAAIVYSGWSHVDGEPNGTYVFKFTIHGTLNGKAVDLVASAPPIKMTR
ncbi:MAG TPA: hypothetical protein VLU96_09325 [Gaiellaceae bacterium]|nr:hypothetical protein [Gaiellaceae bacterium]